MSSTLTNLSLTMIGLAVAAAAPAATAQVPYVTTQNKVTSALAPDTYWTADRLKNAKTLDLKPTSAPALTSAMTFGASEGAPQHSTGSRPTVDLGGALATQLFLPAAASGLHPDVSVIPDNVGGFGAYFTTTRVFPDSAVTTYPNSAAGKLYFHDPVGGGDFQCTASAISHRVIVTAGHCTAHASTTKPYFYTNFLFIPAFNNGAAPYAKWGWNFATTTSNWYFSNGSVPNKQDVGMIVTSDTSYRGVVHRLGDVTGWLGWWTQWGRSYPNNITQLGYPCNLDSCVRMELNTAQGDGISNNTVEIGSAMQGGSSGGPWIQDYGVAPVGAPAYTAGNWVVGVTSWGFTNTALMGQGASIFENAGYPGNGFGDLWNLACGHAPGNC